MKIRLKILTRVRAFQIQGLREFNGIMEAKGTLLVFHVWAIINAVSWHHTWCLAIQIDTSWSFRLEGSVGILGEWQTYPEPQRKLQWQEVPITAHNFYFEIIATSTSLIIRRSDPCYLVYEWVHRRSEQFIRPTISFNGVVVLLRDGRHGFGRDVVVWGSWYELKHTRWWAWIAMVPSQPLPDFKSG